jgi:hypothetical protein
MKENETKEALESAKEDSRLKVIAIQLATNPSVTTSDSIDTLIDNAKRIYEFIK